MNAAPPLIEVVTTSIKNVWLEAREAVARFLDDDVVTAVGDRSFATTLQSPEALLKVTCALNSQSVILAERESPEKENKVTQPNFTLSVADHADHALLAQST